jgi:hypothetical protein
MTARILFVCASLACIAACSNSPESAAAQSAAPAASPAAGPVKPPSTDAEKIANAMAAAPDALSKDATILEFDATMQPRTLRAGTNGWTCLPDFAPSPGVDPMCLDANAVLWVQAWAAKKAPPADKMGFGYMLLGGSDASNSDPFATTPAAGHGWVDTGPHVMIFNIGNRFDGYPSSHDNTKVPYVMFANTPYAHLMLPVGEMRR